MRYASFAAAMAVLLSTGLATASQKVQGNVVGANGAGNPTVDAKSKFKMDSKGNVQLGLKGVTDAMGNPAAVTNGTTPDTEYVLIVKGDAAGIPWEFNILFNITKEGQTKVKASAGSLLMLGMGVPVGVLGVEVFEPTTAGSAAACTAVLTGAIPGVYLGPAGGNPCATGARVGYSGIVPGS